MGHVLVRADAGASPGWDRASYPNFAGKHTEEAMFTPADFAAYLRRAGALGSYQPPAGVVLCYQRSLYSHVLQAEGLTSPGRQGALHGLLLLPSTGGRVGLLGQFGIGAPAALRRWKSWRRWARRPLSPWARRGACSAT